MKLKRKVLLHLLCAAVFALGGTAVASVMVPGSDGASKPLSQIPDIMRHVTGEKGETIQLKKHSLLMVEAKNPEGTLIDITPSLYTFETDGVYRLDGATDRRDNFWKLNWNLRGAVRPAPLSVASDHNQMVTVSEVYGKNLARFVTQRDADGKLTLKGGIYNGTTQEAGQVIDRKSGMTVKGFDGEVYAELWKYASNKELNAYFYPANRGEAANFSIQTESGPFYQQFSEPLYFEKDADVRSWYHIPSGIAVGDFDGDGYANEAAIIYTDMKEVTLKVYQFNYDSLLRGKEIFSSVLHTYNYPKGSQARSRLESMDGLTRMLFATVVAGDFDGDGKTEFAAVYRDLDGGDLNTDKGGYTFPGVSGRVRVAVHKWNGSGFAKEETVQNYGYWTDTYSSNYMYKAGGPIGLKAVAADLNGDGRSEVVVMRLQFDGSASYYEQYYNRGPVNYTSIARFYLDVWECAAGSIKPSAPWTIDTRTGFTDDVMDMKLVGKDGFTGSTNNTNVLQVITGDTQRYPFMDRECDIVAGKFTGRMGAGTICDDLVVRYPERHGNIDERTNENKLIGKMKLLSDIEKGKRCTATELKSSLDRKTIVGLAVADYASEGAELGVPEKTVSDIKDRSYLAILQAPPFHVDNLTADGTTLQAKPRNFTYRNGSEVSYSKSTGSSSKEVVSFEMRSSVETVFGFDSPELRDAIGKYKKIKGVTSSVLGNKLVQFIPGVKAVDGKFSGITKIVDSLLDKVTKTTKTTNDNASSTNIRLMTAATKQDVAYFSKADRYIWRYPILTKPAPAWLVGERADEKGNFAGAKVSEEQNYISFAINDTPSSTMAYAMDDSLYQPFHEPGNLFSYPAALDQIEGYAGRKELTGPLTWNGPKIEQTLLLTKEKGEQTVESKKVETGEITSQLSFIDSIFKTNLAKIPNEGNPKNFTRTTSSAESLTVKIPELSSGAGHNIDLDCYLDPTGAMKTAFAVTAFNNEDMLWGDDSIYRKKPDPSLVLPYKFPYSQQPDDKGDVIRGFAGNDNDPTALKMKGVRFFAPAYGLGSNNLLVKGVKYKISVPVYNASFVDAGSVTVRLSYAKTNKYNAERTKIADAVVKQLPGWGKGNRVWAEFEWKPDVSDGTYYLFAEIDPDGAINEIHENRRDAAGKITDYGGNNLGVFRIGVASTESPVFNRNEQGSVSAADAGEFGVRTAGVGSVTTADDDTEIPKGYVLAKIKLNGLTDLEEFRDKYLKNATEPVPVDITVEYQGDYLFPSVNVVGYEFMDSAKDKLERGETLTDDDIGMYFLNETLTLFPNEPQTFTFLMDPALADKMVNFALEFPRLAKVQANDPSSDTGHSSHSGCEVGMGSLALLALAGLGIMATKQRRS